MKMTHIALIKFSNQGDQIKATEPLRFSTTKYRLMQRKDPFNLLGVVCNIGSQFTEMHTPHQSPKSIDRHKSIQITKSFVPISWMRQKPRVISSSIAPSPLLHPLSFYSNIKTACTEMVQHWNFQFVSCLKLIFSQFSEFVNFGKWNGRKRNSFVNGVYRLSLVGPMGSISIIKTD